MVAKKILIIYPHWPPSNLAGIHRARLIANFLHDYDWESVVLTVNHEYYEETLDFDLLKTVSDKIKVHYVSAYKPLKRFRFFGDIGLRSFFQLYKVAQKIIRDEEINFVWIPIPSFYTSIIGRLLHNKIKIAYGVDYIDPWVNGFTNYEKLFSKAWISNILAKILEPYAVKNASLISGVSSTYYQPVLDRNFKNKPIRHVGMPYGFDPNDHTIKINIGAYPWSGINQCLPLVYAGAFLPKSHYFIKTLFKSISILISEKKWNENIHLFFLGTGKYPGKTIADYANEYGIVKYVHEYAQRYPFLHVLSFLSASHGVMVIGSTEQHYTASKIFQSILSNRPVFAILHNDSSALTIMKESKAANYAVAYIEVQPELIFLNAVKSTFQNFLTQKELWKPDINALNKYSASTSAKLLVEQLNSIVS